MNKPITDIQENTVDGTVTFKFMGGIDNEISQLNVNEAPTHIYSIDGRYLGTDRTKLAKGLYIIGKKKTTI
jgi:immune inhibitor A